MQKKVLQIFSLFVFASFIGSQFVPYTSFVDKWAVSVAHADGNKKKSKKKGDGIQHLWEYKKKHFNLYAKNDDIRIGEHYMGLQIKAFKRDDKGVDLPKHRELKTRIEKIVSRLAAVSDEPNFPYEVHIFDKPDVVNAFCMPGGKIGVFTGLFDEKKGLVDINNDDQIAAVLGHEMAHATLRHATRQATSMQGLGFLGTVASVALGQGVGAEAQVIFNRVFNIGANLYLPSYSRKHEAEADQVGFYYMSKARFNPIAAVDIWQKAASRGGPNSKKTDFFASHPASGERAHRLKKWLPEAEGIKNGTIAR